jgi:hypothetical protein
MKAPARKNRWRGRLAALMAFLAAAALIWLLPVFHLSEIEISPLTSLNDQEILEASGLQTGRHLLKGLGGSLEQILHLRYPAVEAALNDKFPAIRTVTVRMRFPGRIAIEIDERLQVAYLSIPDGCVMIDKDCVAIRILEEPPAGIPVIQGVTATSLILGKTIEVDVPAALNSAASLMGAIIDADKDTRTEMLLLPAISKIRPIGGRRLYLTVVLPDSGEELNVEAETGADMQEDMLWLRFALSQGVFKDLGKGVLDLTGSRRVFTPDS